MSAVEHPKKLTTNEMNHLIMSHLKTKYFMLDSYLYDKCMEFSKMNITAEQFEGKKSLCVMLSAPVVELSLLDAFTSPESKLNCLCTTYDLIFAELKSALAQSLSKHSDEELDIPIVENKDVIPALMIVIIKSKLRYLWSNVEYIKLFIDDIKTEDYTIIRTVLTAFETAVNKLLKFPQGSVKREFEEEMHSLSLLEIMNLGIRNEDSPTTLNTHENDDRKHDLLQEQTDRIVDLIITCTTANHPV